MNWKKATLAQLYEIAYYDKECNPKHKFAAAEEINRRKQSEQASNRGGIQVKTQRKRA